MNFLKSFVAASMIFVSYVGYATDSLRNSLDAAMADEWAAYGRYQSVLLQFGDIRPFRNLIRAEERHMDLLKGQYQRFGWELPTLQNTSLTLFASVQEACALSLEAEQKNVDLYDRLLAETNDIPVRDTFMYLREASLEHHIPALSRCLGFRPGFSGSR